MKEAGKIVYPAMKLDILLMIAKNTQFVALFMIIRKRMGNNQSGFSNKYSLKYSGL